MSEEFNTNETVTFAADDIEKNKVFAVLAYLGILVLIPIFAVKDSPYTKFHANQGLVLCIVEIAISVLSRILRYVPFLGTIVGLVNLVAFVLAIIGIINACKGEGKELPIVGSFKILK